SNYPCASRSDNAERIQDGLLLWFSWDLDVHDVLLGNPGCVVLGYERDALSPGLPHEASVHAQHFYLAHVGWRRDHRPTDLPPITNSHHVTAPAMPCPDTLRGMPGQTALCFGDVDAVRGGETAGQEHRHGA